MDLPSVRTSMFCALFSDQSACLQVDEVEKRLQRLYYDLRGRRGPESVGIDLQSPSDSIEGRMNDEESLFKQSEVLLALPAEPTHAEKLSRELEGVNLMPIKKVVGMSLPDASKMVPLSKLLARQSVLIGLLADGEKELWDSSGQVLTGPPDWDKMSILIESVEGVRASEQNKLELQEKKGASEERGQLWKPHVTQVCVALLCVAVLLSVVLTSSTNWQW